MDATILLNLVSSVRVKLQTTYVKDIDPVSPISIDQVMENRLPKSQAPFLRLPSELLSAIIQQVDTHALGNLALVVNRYCRQLARACQFENVCFEYSPRS